MNYLLTISYSDRKVQLNLWSDSVLQDKIETEDASSHLITSIDSILQKNLLSIGSLEKIGFLTGPGSFTSSRVVAATCAGIKTVYKDVLIVPTLLNQAIHSLDKYKDVDILLKCNLQTWHLYQKGKWLLLPDTKLASYLTNQYTSPTPVGGSCLEWPDVSSGIAKHTWPAKAQEAIIPYYGFEFPFN
jgi:tRNA A37 threonylcarbamoyladenosine modification protein TsaB